MPNKPRPKGIPKRIPAWAWKWLTWTQRGKKGKRPKNAPKRIPSWAWAWKAWRQDAKKIPPVPKPKPKPKPRISAKARAACVLARKQLGKPYVFGAAGPNAFDCSGLVQYVYKAQGVELPRDSEEQWTVGKHIARADLREGDILFFEGVGETPPGHEGLYLGSGQFIEAPHTGANVRVSRLAGYPGYMGARRVV